MSSCCLPTSEQVYNLGNLMFIMQSQINKDLETGYQSTIGTKGSVTFYVSMAFK
jgi:hypothetical protein